MARRKSYILVAIFVLLICTETALGEGNGNNGNGNSGNNNGNGNKGDNNGNGNKRNKNGNANKGNDNGSGNDSHDDGNENEKAGDHNGNGNKGKGSENGNKGNGNGNKKGRDDDPDTTNYNELTPLTSGQERHFCKGKGTCYYKTLVCPAECPGKKPKRNKRNKGCFVNCGSKCEATCKWRKPNCNGYGSLCYDPRFVGGDGVMFYFHGAKGGNFAIVSDDDLQINAHFIGTRPQGRTRDFTWVQALAVMFDTHTLVIAASRVSHWDDNVDVLSIRWEGEAINIPTYGDAEWKINAEGRQVMIERTDDTNHVRVKVSGLAELNIKVRPIGKEENRVHNYQLPNDDAFAHLETQFKFTKLSDLVEGVLGKTYRPDYVSPVKKGVPMPMMGGEDKYQTPSLFSPLCKVCKFERPSRSASI